MVQPLALLVDSPFVTRQAKRRDERVNVAWELSIAVVLIWIAGVPP